MEKITKRMSKGNSVGIGVGVASLLLSGCLAMSNEKKIDKLESEKDELQNIVIQKDNVIDSYKAKTIKLEDSVVHFENLTKNLNNDLKVIKEENVKLEAEKKAIETKVAKQAEEKKKLAVTTSSNNYYETTMEVTAYTAGYESTQKSKGQKGYGLTASGTYVQEGRTIACPKSMKFGTVIEIEGYGKRICEDRGGAIKSGKLDLYMDSLADAKKFGRKKLKVKIYNS